MDSSSRPSSFWKRRAVAPAVTPPDFPDPVFCPARRVHGLVETPAEDTTTETSDVEDDDAHSNSASTHLLPEDATTAPSLVRRPSVTGNVLLVAHPTRGTRAYLLQRKTATTLYGGSVRVGFCLQGTTAGPDGLWRVATAGEASSASPAPPRPLAIPADPRGRYEMVTVYMETETQLRGTPTGEGGERPPRADTLQTELAALQWIAKAGTPVDHLWGSEFMGKDNGLLCTVLTPWHTDGTLLDYCATQRDGILPLDEGKFFFRQILKGLQQLQTVGICHRNISLDTILLDGRTCRLTHYGSALRIPMDGSVPHLIASQPVGGRDPESIAPELWAQQDFDGYAVDLWSVGIVLWKMVVPTAKVQLFAAPVLDDFRYRDYCVEGKLQERLQVASGLPADVVDLLTGLLRANPVERFTLGQVLDHPWLAE